MIKQGVTDLRKKAFRKFEHMPLRNVIDVTNAQNQLMLVSPTNVWLCTFVVTDFILGKGSNF